MGRALLEKLIMLAVFYETQVFIAVFTTAGDIPLS
jgi:hypothetical protein